MARNEGIDIAKGSGIILVMIGHLSIPYLLMNFIYFFHMPFFVLVSGMFFRKKPLNISIKEGFRLYISYLIYGTFFLLLNYLMNGGFQAVQLTDMILGKPEGIWNVPYFETFWFIGAIVVIKTTAQFLIPNKITLVISLAFFCTILYLQKSLPLFSNLPFGISQAAALSPFYIIGYMTRQNYFPAKNKLLWVSLIFLILSTLILIVENGNRNGVQLVNYHLLRVFDPVLALLLGVSGSVSLVYFGEHIARFRYLAIDFLRHVGEYSFVYFALHIAIFSFIGYLSAKMGLTNNLIQTIIIFISSFLIIRGFITIMLRVRGWVPDIADLILLK